MSENKLERVLVTGARGVIGSRIVPMLERDFEVVPTDLGHSDLPGYEAANLMDFSRTYRLLEQVDSVVHLAAATGAGRAHDLSPSELDPVDEKMLRVNPTTAHHVLEAAARLGLRRVVYVSSLTILIADKERKSYTDDMQVDPTNLYACSKLFGEQFAFVKWRDFGLSTICLRLGQPYPVGHEFDDAWRTSPRARSFRVHVEDIALGIKLALQTSCEFGVYNLVSRSDNQRVDLSQAQRDLGYDPQAFFAESGLVLNAASPQ